MVAQIQKSW